MSTTSHRHPRDTRLLDHKNSNHECAYSLNHDVLSMINAYTQPYQFSFYHSKSPISTKPSYYSTEASFKQPFRIVLQMNLFRRSRRPAGQPREQSFMSNLPPAPYSIHSSENTASSSWGRGYMSPEEQDIEIYLDTEAMSQGYREAQSPDLIDSPSMEVLEPVEFREAESISRRRSEAQRQVLNGYYSAQNSLEPEDEWVDDVFESEYEDEPHHITNQQPSYHNNMSSIDDWLDGVVEAEHEYTPWTSTITSSSHESTDSFSHIVQTLYEIEEQEEKQKREAVEELDGRGRRLFEKLSWEQKQTFYHKATKKDRSAYLKVRMQNLSLLEQ